MGEKGQQLGLPEDRRAPREGSIQLIVTLVFKTFDLGQVNMHSNLAPLQKKKVLYKTVPDIQLSCLQYVQQKEAAPPTHR